MNRINIYGILPPPFGGVSIYHKRLIAALREREIEFTFYQSNKTQNTGEKKVSLLSFFLRMVNFNKEIIHISGLGSIRIHIALTILNVFFNKKTIITVHNKRIDSEYYSLTPLRKIVGKLFLKSIKHAIIVNSETKTPIINKEKKTTTIPAYIPPSHEETETSQLPDFFHEIRRKHKFLLTANAFKISFHEGEDLYGIDLSIELMRCLVERGYTDIGLVYVIPEVGDYSHLERMKNLVRQYNLTNWFHFYTNPLPYPAVINMCDVFIRPTNTDGDAISLREALFLKKPAIASDIVLRPQGVVLFKCRNAEDLLEKTVDIIEHFNTHKKRIENISFDDNTQKTIDVYKKILGE